jgi:hypothetical protein
MSFEMTALLLAWVAILLLALVVSGLIRQVHELTRGPQTPGLGLPVGMAAPDLDRLGSADLPTLLLFLSADCGVCPGVLNEAAVLAHEDGNPAVQAVYAGAPGDTSVADHVRVHGDQATLFDTYQVPATPFAVLVDQAGRISASAPVGSPGSLRNLVGVTSSRS